MNWIDGSTEFKCDRRFSASFPDTAEKILIDISFISFISYFGIAEFMVVIWAFFTGKAEYITTAKVVAQ